MPLPTWRNSSAARCWPRRPAELISPLARLLDTLAIREQLPQIEVAVADNATALVLRVLASPAAEDLARLRAFAHAHGVRIYLQTRRA